ncbi:hypothetical protein AGMMS50239_26990 [Bacteroidia bacterium]|nr:hypothetical protein AGMMS50239_26990 [Bacteroidia bacterium]
MIQLKENILFANKYKLLKSLGHGASSEVWMAEHTLTGVDVALKIYAPGMGLDEDGVQFFSKEFALVFNMNHPNLLRPTHYDIEERMPYLVMPYCEKGSTLKLVGNMSEKEAWRFLYDVASGLAYLHGKEPPVIHQDIKPENILIGSDGAFQITDFGISTKIRSTLHKNMVQNENQVGGTIAYTGPERFNRNNRPKPASDIWALGASVYELLEGGAPFGYDLGGSLQKNGADIPEMEGDWSSELKQVVERCLAKETWDRPTAADIVVWAERHLAGKSISIIDKEIENEEETDEQKPETSFGKKTILMSSTQDKPTVRTEQIKKKSKIPLIAGLVAVLLIAAFFVYKFAGNPETPVTVPSSNIVEIPIDTPEIVQPTAVLQEEEIKQEQTLPETKTKAERKKTADDYLQEGNDNYRTGNYEAAIENFKKCIELSSVPQEGAKDRIREMEDSLQRKKEKEQ